MTTNNTQGERQARVAALVEQGYSRAEATGTAWAEAAGEKTLPAHGVDEPKGERLVTWRGRVEPRR